MKTRSPLMMLAAIQFQHSFPTFLKAALNSSRYLALKYPNKVTRSAYLGIRNWYESGWPVHGNGDSWTPGMVQDSRFDLNYVSRRESMRRMRYWERNSAIVEAILSVGERYTVGSAGLPVTIYPDNTDDSNAWYSSAEKDLREWMLTCGWGDEPMSVMLKVGYRRQRVDGDVFFLPTRKQGKVNFNGTAIDMFVPCIQMIESHRVETPWSKFDDGELIDGVQFDKVSVDGRNLLRKKGFWVRTGHESFENVETHVLIPKEKIFQINNQHRVNQYRGITDFYPCEPDIHKLEDLLEVEMKAHASQSVRAVGIESNSGQASTGNVDKKLQEVLRATGRLPAKSDNAEEKALMARFDAMRRETGAYVYGLKKDEKVHFDSPNRPSESTLQLWEFLVNSVCAGSKSSRTLTFNRISGQSSKPQGTEVRADLDNADLFFRGDFQKWKSLVKQISIFYLDWAIKNKPELRNPPKNWQSCLHIHQPESCNVDIGYTTNAELMMLAAGAMDYDMILGPKGMSFMTVAKRLKRQQKFLEDNKIQTTLPALMRGQIPLQLKGQEENEQT